ncbi:MAG: hypothetical protein GY832_37010 [Chloroflexi bacterium]|nr:hypothetical protein [Chloroflexota bacterium]
MFTQSGKMVDPKDTRIAIESAYATLPDAERAEIDELAGALMQRMAHRRGIGERTVRQILGAIGIYLTTHPRVCACFDADDRFVGFTRKFHSQVQMRPPAI